MLPILVAMASSLWVPVIVVLGAVARKRDPAWEILDWPACWLDHGQDVLIMVVCDRSSAARGPGARRAPTTMG
jgi:hypothetical protein